MNIFFLIPTISQALLWSVFAIILPFFVRVRVLGKENIKCCKKGVIFAINHSSDIDPILILVTLTPLSQFFPVFSVSLPRVFYKRKWPLHYLYGGLLFKLLGSFPVSIGTRKDYSEILKSHIRILEKNGSVGIFPEGQRSFDGNLKKGKPGVAYLLWKTGRPVIPVAIHGHHQMKPIDFLKRKRLVTVFYGKPITRKEVFSKKVAGGSPPSLDDLKFATNIIMSRIRDMYDAI